MTSKLRVKVGEIEFEFEGSEEFLKAEIPEILKSILAHRREVGVSPIVTPATGQAPGAESLLQGTTATFAAKLGGSSGPELAITAAARLRFALGSDTFTRSKLIEEMKTATSYYKRSYNNNLTKTLAVLVSNGKFIECAKDTYSLHANLIAELQAKLAN